MRGQAMEGRCGRTADMTFVSRCVVLGGGRTDEKVGSQWHLELEAGVVSELGSEANTPVGGGRGKG